MTRKIYFTYSEMLKIISKNVYYSPQEVTSAQKTITGITEEKMQEELNKMEQEEKQ